MEATGRHAENELRLQAPGTAGHLRPEGQTRWSEASRLVLGSLPAPAVRPPASAFPPPVPLPLPEPHLQRAVTEPPDLVISGLSTTNTHNVQALGKPRSFLGRSEL